MAHSCHELLKKMKIGIFSDLHNRTDHLEPAMHRMRLLGCGHFIFLGDCTTPESFRRLIELTEDFPLDAVPGNNDYDVETMRRMAASSPAARLHPEHALITRYGMKLPSPITQNTPCGKRAAETQTPPCTAIPTRP